MAQAGQFRSASRDGNGLAGFGRSAGRERSGSAGFGRPVSRGGSGLAGLGRSAKQRCSLVLAGFGRRVSSDSVPSAVSGWRAGASACSLEESASRAARPQPARASAAMATRAATRAVAAGQAQRGPPTAGSHQPGCRGRRARRARVRPAVPAASPRPCRASGVLRPRGSQLPAPGSGIRAASR